MNIQLFADPLEVRNALRSLTDSRFADLPFGSAAVQATSEILAVLRPKYQVEQLFLDHFTTSTLQGVVTSGGTNTLTLTGAGWTASEFAGNIPVEAVIWNDTAFYVADVTANTTDTLTLASIGRDDLTIAADDKFYLRRKLGQLNSHAISFALYNFINANRLVRGVQALPEIASDVRSTALYELERYLTGDRDLDYLYTSESVTLNNDEWQYLSNKFVVADSVTVTKSSVGYREAQGWEINHAEGAIRWIDSTHTTRLAATDTITVTYRYTPRLFQ